MDEREGKKGLLDILPRETSLREVPALDCVDSSLGDGDVKVTASLYERPEPL